MKYLLVIDMQEDYVGDFRNKKLYPYETQKLISNINKKIQEYPSENVVYIVNRFFFESRNEPKKLVDKLLAVSNNIFEKKRSNCFSNNELLKYLQQKNVTEIELAGVDGNHCVSASAFGGVKNSLEVSMDITNVGVANKKKFAKTINKLRKAGINIKM